VAGPEEGDFHRAIIGGRSSTPALIADARR
jgi:hypothetical protein